MYNLDQWARLSQRPKKKPKYHQMFRFYVVKHLFAFCSNDLVILIFAITYNHTNINMHNTGLNIQMLDKVDVEIINKM